MYMLYTVISGSGVGVREGIRVAVGEMLGVGLGAVGGVAVGCAWRVGVLPGVGVGGTFWQPVTSMMTPNKESIHFFTIQHLILVC
jgi:hypothetical protein